jgi:hypothetical protein
MSTTGTSPTLTPVSILRATGARYDFDGVENWELLPPRSAARSLPPAMPRSAPRSSKAATTPGTVESTGASRRGKSTPQISIGVYGLGRPQRAVHSHVISLLRELTGGPQLDGMLVPTAAQMDMYAPLQAYLKTVLCPVPSGRPLTLRRLIDILLRVPAFNLASEAIIGAALIDIGMHDPSTWTSDQSSKLDKWIVRASFWDVQPPHPTFYRPLEDTFHQRLILAAKELSAFGRVCISGHGFLLPIMREYAGDLLAAARGAATTAVQKRAVDCVLAAFGSRASMAMLYQTRFADALDGFSIPLASTSLRADAWSPALKAWFEDAETVGELSLTERLGVLGEAVITAARPYAWMLVATQHMVNPASIDRSAACWETAMITWDPRTEGAVKDMPDD